MGRRMYLSAHFPRPHKLFWTLPTAQRPRQSPNTSLRSTRNNSPAAHHPPHPPPQTPAPPRAAPAGYLRLCPPAQFPPHQARIPRITTAHPPGPDPIASQHEALPPPDLKASSSPPLLQRFLAGTVAESYSVRCTLFRCASTGKGARRHQRRSQRLGRSTGMQVPRRGRGRGGRESTDQPPPR